MNLGDGKKRVLYAIHKHSNRSTEDGVSVSEISDIVDISRNVASKHCGSLKERGYVEDLSGWEHQTNYVVSEGVDVDRNYKWQDFFDVSTTIQILSAITALSFIGLHVFGFLYGPTYTDMYIVMVVGILPTMIHTLWRNIRTDDHQEISVSRHNDGV